ncbi:hypothetical protein [Solicola gregarius]|uniref:BON domain-containing protein n=1 Tax=Solicola gregarius TaxID=2908642 RepID=A0AA46TEF2_9ACTN|nr:hypothetical protein [Solicola gregarius]UYM03620.1 hypothetical protein L0C25_13785 [Solicola gregarius]
MAMATSAYEIRVRGEITHALANALTPMGWSIDTDDGSTVLSGNVRDQAELRGILDSLAAISLELLEVRQVEAPPDAP